MPKKQKTQTKKKCLGDDFYYVDQVLGERRFSDGRVQCYVSWVGYSSKYNSWVNRDTIMAEE